MTTQSSSSEASSHDNTVKLTGSMIQAISYIQGSLVITTGQPSSPPPSITQTGADWKITLKCGRKKSKSVATSFIDTTGGSVHEYAPEGGGGGSPDELNFYYGVKVTIMSGSTPVTTTLYLAQGSHGSTNNWWIGGNSIINTGKPLLLVISNNIIEQILSLSGSNDSFKMTPMS